MSDFRHARSDAAASQPLIEPLEARQLLANTAGVLDPTFGANGVANIAGLPASQGLAIDSNGRTLTAGTVGGDIFIARLVNGDLDTTFGGGDGKVLQNLGGSDQVADLALQADGRILVAGTTNATKTGQTGVFVARFNADGSLDTTFAGRGYAIANFGFALTGTSLAVEPDGTIVAAGTESGATTTGSTTGFVVHLNARGRFDTSFGSGGIARLTTGTKVIVNDVTTDSTGRILVAGSRGTISNIFLSRMSESGVVESTFPQIAQINTGGTLSAITVDRFGRIVAAGETSQNLALVLRFVDGGTLDTSFGGSGVFTSTINSNDPFVGITDIVARRDQSIVFGGIGTTQSGQTFSNDFLVGRLTSTGSLDPTFGQSGTGFTQIDISGNGQNDAVKHIALQSNGAVVAAGSSGVAGFAGPIVRLTGDNGVPTPPRGAVVGAPLLRQPLKYFSFDVTYTSNDVIDLSTIDGNDIIVDGSNGFAGKAAVVSKAANAAGTTVTVTYAVRGPTATGWTRSQNGTYDVHLQDGQVANLSGLTNLGRKIGTLTVRIPKGA